MNPYSDLTTSVSIAKVNSLTQHPILDLDLSRIYISFVKFGSSQFPLYSSKPSKRHYILI